MDARDTGDLARRLGDAVEHVDPAAEINDGHHQDEEDDDREGELDEGLAAFARPAQRPHHGSTRMTSVFVVLPIEFEAARVTVNPGFVLLLV